MLRKAFRPTAHEALTDYHQRALPSGTSLVYFFYSLKRGFLRPRFFLRFLDIVRLTKIVFLSTLLADNTKTKTILFTMEGDGHEVSVGH